MDARRHGELLAPFIDRVLASAGAGRGDLTAIAVGTGPGPYTGLRAGLVTARVLGSALGIPVDGVCTLDMIAARGRAAPGGEFLVATDARRKELYWARYSAGRRAARRAARSAAAADLPAGLPVAGEGALLYPELGAEPIGPRYPDAARAGRHCGAADRCRDSRGPGRAAVPAAPDAREPGQRKRVTP